MQLYKVKLNEGHTAKRDQIYGTYLGDDDGLALYTRGEALKKARMFGGSIEPQGRNYITAKLNILQLSRNELSTEALLELNKRHVMVDKLSVEMMYFGDVFSTILTENYDRPLNQRLTFDCEEEIRVLDHMSHDFEYIMLID